MKPPNPRLNAARLGFHLLLVAANPWSGINLKFAAKAQWQPLDPYGWPRWWPLGAFRGRSVSLGAVQLMREAATKAGLAGRISKTDDA